MAGAATTNSKTKKPRAAKKPAAKKAVAAKSNAAVAKSRFNAALDEAKAGASALTAEAKERGAAYSGKARSAGEDVAAQAKVKAAELAAGGKTKASDALSSLSKAVGDNAEILDDKLGTKYGDYARTASRSLQETAVKLDAKSVDDIGADARDMVRRNPGKAIGVAAIVGFFFARLFRK